MAHPKLLEEAASDGRHGVDGTFKLIDQNTVEGELNMEVVLLVYKSKLTAKVYCCARAVVSRRTMESRRYMFREMFTLLRSYGLQSPLASPVSNMAQVTGVDTDYKFR